MSPLGGGIELRLCRQQRLAELRAVAGAQLRSVVEWRLPVAVAWERCAVGVGVWFFWGGLIWERDGVVGDLVWEELGGWYGSNVFVVHVVL